jgi:tRNA threonylcarbamoyl adenosine modification protein YjeE
LLKHHEVIELRSDLGGGKTTFVRGLMRGLGSKDRVSSPTFKLNNIYQADHIEVHHFDFYRLDEPGVLSEQLQESLQNSRVITVVEWSDIVKDVLPSERLTIEFKPVADNPDERLIEISYPESKTELVERLETIWIEVEP